MTTGGHMITHSLHTEHGHNKGWAEAQCLDLDGLDGRKHLVPPNDIADLVQFIFNNLSPLSTMVNEFCECVGHAYLP